MKLKSGPKIITKFASANKNILGYVKKDKAITEIQFITNVIRTHEHRLQLKIMDLINIFTNVTVITIF